MEHIAVGEMNRAVQRAQRDIGPSEIHRPRVDRCRDVEREADDVEQHRQLEQVHHVPVGQRDIAWHIAGFAISEIRGLHPPARCCPEARGGDKEQHQERHGGEGDGGVELLVPSVALMPSCLMTPAQRGISRSIALANSAGVPGMTSRPRSFSFLRTSGCARIFTVSRFNRSMIAGGVPAGAIRPNHGTASKSAYPASIIVGRSGAAAERLTRVTAKARRRPSRTGASTFETLPNASVTRPASRSGSIAVVPRYATGRMSTPAMDLNSSAARCWDVPTPACA